MLWVAPRRVLGVSPARTCFPPKSPLTACRVFASIQRQIGTGSAMDDELSLVEQQIKLAEARLADLKRHRDELTEEAAAEDAARPAKRVNNSAPAKAGQTGEKAGENAGEKAEKAAKEVIELGDNDSDVDDDRAAFEKRYKEIGVTRGAARIPRSSVFAQRAGEYNATAAGRRSPIDAAWFNKEFLYKGRRRYMCGGFSTFVKPGVRYAICGVETAVTDSQIVAMALGRSRTWQNHKGVEVVEPELGSFTADEVRCALEGTPKCGVCEERPRRMMVNGKLATRCKDCEAAGKTEKSDKRRQEWLAQAKRNIDAEATVASLEAGNVPLHRTATTEATSRAKAALYVRPWISMATRHGNSPLLTCLRLVSHEHPSFTGSRTALAVYPDEAAMAADMEKHAQAVSHGSVTTKIIAITDARASDDGKTPPRWGRFGAAVHFLCRHGVLAHAHSALFCCSPFFLAEDYNEEPGKHRMVICATIEQLSRRKGAELSPLHSAYNPRMRKEFRRPMRCIDYVVVRASDYSDLDDVRCALVPPSSGGRRTAGIRSHSFVLLKHDHGDDDDGNDGDDSPPSASSSSEGAAGGGEGWSPGSPWPCYGQSSPDSSASAPACTAWPLSAPPCTAWPPSGRTLSLFDE